MKCPKCNKEINKNYCMFCGYILDKDTFIDKNKTGETSLLELYFGDQFDKKVRKCEPFKRFILGPMYIAIKGFIIEGLLFTFLDLALLYFIHIFNVNFPLPGFGKLFDYVLIFVNVIFCMTLDSILYIFLLKRKLERIKKKNPNNYLNILEKLDIGKHDLINFLVIFFAFITIILFIFYLYIK